jgi:hypothetical protein
MSNAQLLITIAIQVTVHHLYHEDKPLPETHEPKLLEQSKEKEVKDLVFDESDRTWKQKS